jgi:hypothetical protein
VRKPRFGPAIGESFEIDEARGPIDRDIGVAALEVERRQVFEIDMDEARRSVGLEGDGVRLLRRETGGEAVLMRATWNAPGETAWG